MIELVARMENIRNPYKIFVGESEEKVGLPLGRLRRRWEDNIKKKLRLDSTETV